MSKYVKEYIVKVTVVDYDAMFGDALDALRDSEQLLMEQVEALPQPLEEVVFDDVDESLGKPGGIVFVNSTGLARMLSAGEILHL